MWELPIVDLATFEVVGAPLPGPEGALTRLSFSPGGRSIAAVTDHDLGAGLVPAVALVWDVAQGGEPIVQYPFSAANRERDVAFLPDSRRILVAGSTARRSSRSPRGRIGQITAPPTPIAINPDGRTLAAALAANQGVTIGLFDLTSGRPSAPLAGHRERLARLAFSPDGTRLASGADDHLVMLWDVASGQRRACSTRGHAAGIEAAAFSPDGEELWSGGDDHAIFVWDLQHHGLARTRGPEGAFEEPALAFVAADMNIKSDDRCRLAFPWAEINLTSRSATSNGCPQPPISV